MNKRLVTDRDLIGKRLPVLIAASVAEFDRKGFHATTIQDVAQTSGVSVGLIYRYVTDKTDLLYLAIVDVAARYEAEMEINRASDLPEGERLWSLLHALARVVVEKRAAARLGYREVRYLRHDQIVAVKKGEERLLRYLEERIQACIEAGEIRDCDVPMLAYQSLIFIQSWPVSVWRFKERLTVENYVRRGLDTLFSNLRVHKP